MGSYEDIVWDAITDSAKGRFDYAAFEANFSEFGYGNIAENILFMTIVGHVQKHSVEKIASDIRGQLLMMGVAGKERWIDEFVEARQEDLKSEISAAEMAIALTQMGVDTPKILDLVRSGLI